jgi:AhpD family alkylhydroperoxidase
MEDFRFILEQRSMVRRTLRELIPAAFRERLMAVVTEVNGCRYCSYMHARLALSAGATQEELRQMLSGTIPAETPQDELLALTYAQHWAESDARPGPEASQKLLENYGAQKAEAIHIVLHMIRMGNLSRCSALTSASSSGNCYLSHPSSPSLRWEPIPPGVSGPQLSNRNFQPTSTCCPRMPSAVWQCSGSFNE